MIGAPKGTGNKSTIGNSQPNKYAHSSRVRCSPSSRRSTSRSAGWCSHLALTMTSYLAGCVAIPFRDYPERNVPVEINDSKGGVHRFEIKGKFSDEEVGEVRAALSGWGPKLLHDLECGRTTPEGVEQPYRIRFSDNDEFAGKTGITH